MEILPPKIPITVVIVGSVDHGKSTFIGRFLYDSKNLAPDKLDEIKKQAEESGKKMEFAHVMDQFSEEREHNITIDTAQTFFALGTQAYIFIDAPGHKEYLKNMITGATQAENALLMLDAAEGVMAQTEKHVQILKWLDISNVSVLINKMDLVGYEESKFNELKEKITKLLSDNGLTAQNIVPISAQEGDNVVHPSKTMTWYKGPAVEKIIREIKESEPKPVENEDLKFPVQLVHSVDKKTYLLGRVEKGMLKKGSQLTVFPSSKKVKVEKISKHNANLKEAFPGDSIGVLVNDSSEIKRGDVLYSEGSELKPVHQFSSQCFWAAPQPLQKNEEILLECRTQTVKAKASKMIDPFEKTEMEKVESGDIAVIDFEVQEPLLIQNQGASDPFSRVVFHRRGDVAGCGVVNDTRGSN